VLLDCSTNKHPSSLSLRESLNLGLQFCSNLAKHHEAEENNLFLYLGSRMPAFKELFPSQYKKLYKSFKELDNYLNKCKDGEELNLEKVKEIMDGFGKELWSHMDEEVAVLRADNMRKFWGVEEIWRMVW
jgi:hemerythrin-like domain-containing protein